MDELKFVLKGLIFAVVVTMVLQVSVGGETLEMKSDRLLHHSAVGSFLNQTAEGAAKLFRQGTQMVSGLMGNKKTSASIFSHKSEGSGWKIETRHQRASAEAVDAEDVTDSE